MGKYGLIAASDAARAAHYGFRLERKGLVPALAQSGEEAISTTQRLGVPALILAEAVSANGDGLTVLRELRQFVRVEDARAILIVASRDEHEQAVRQMIPLGISAVLPRAHSQIALDKAIDAALAIVPGAAPPPGAEGPPEAPPVEIPPHLAAHPLAQRIAALWGLRAHSVEGLQQVASTTGHIFSVPVAITWLACAGRSLFEIHVNEAVPASSPLRDPNRWMGICSLIGADPILVHDVSRYLSDRLPAASLPAALAGAPLVLGGRVVGGIALFQPQVVGGLPPGILDPLQFWAQRLSGDLERLLAPPAPSPPAASPIAVPVPRGVVLESLAACLDSAVLVSDSSGMVCFANDELCRVLRLGTASPVGHARSLVLRNLGTARGVDDGVISAIVGAPRGVRREVQIAVNAPDPGILRWRGRAIELAGAQGRLDEFDDVTIENELAQRHGKLERVDEFTGLANRAASDETLGREVSRARRNGVPFSVAIFAVDNLRLGNPEYGTEVFHKVAKLLRSTAREHDLAARIDRLRLGVVLVDTTGEQAHRFCDRFVAEVRKLRPIVTVSGGSAQFDGNLTGPELVRIATANLAEARRLGGDRVL